MLTSTRINFWDDSIREIGAKIAKIETHHYPNIQWSRPMIDFHVSWSIVVFAKCQFSYLSLWGVSFIVDQNFCPLLFYLLVCPIRICFVLSQLVISLSCRFSSPIIYYTTEYIYLNADHLHLDCIDKICCSTLHQLRFNFHFYYCAPYICTSVSPVLAKHALTIRRNTTHLSLSI